MNDNISKKDKKDWEEFLKNKDKLTDKDKDKEIDAKKHFKIRTIDLHGFTLESANKEIENFIIKSYLNHVNKIIVVTGKGIHSNNENNPYVSKDLSILKYSVPEFIENNTKLMSMINDIQNAKIEDGGSGAFYILLKKNKN